jgi:amino acid adenylation domain-containing protein
MSDIRQRIAELSPERRAYLERLLQARSRTGALRPVPRTAGAPLPCSFGQQRLWFLDRLEPGAPAYIVVSAARLPASFDAGTIERSLQEIVRRHEVLRTTYTEIDGEPMQVIGDVPLPLRRIDLTDRPPQAAEAEVRRIAAEEGSRPFDLRRGPLLRATFVLVTPDASVLLLAMHHIVTDGWSMSVLYRELLALYDAFAAGQPSPLPPLPIQYADFASWQRAWLSGDVLASQLAYWRERLADLSPLELPADRPRPARKSYRGASLPWRLPRPIDEELRRLSQREGVTMFMTLLAGFVALLARYTGQTDIAVGSPVANRTRAELEQLLGFFVNTLVLRTDVSGTPSFRTLLARVRDAAVGAYAHQDLPFERLVEELQPQRDLGRNPLFDVLFHLQSSMSRTSVAPRDEDHVAVERTSVMFDLAFDLFEAPDEVEGTIDYSTDLYDRETIARLAGHYEVLLAAAAADPDRPIAELPLLTERERQQILVEWNATAAPIPETRLHTLFEAQASRTPDGAAVRAGGETLTFAELNRRANRLAHHLRERGIGRDAVVAVRLERSPELIAALLGVLKAGAAYLPLDVHAPAARIDAIVMDAGAAAVVTRETMETVANGPDANLAAPGSPDDLAYVIYTSGSTGVPKGVEVTHRSVVNLSLALREAIYGEGAAPLRVSLNGSVAVDTSVKQLVQMLDGHCLVVVPDDVRADAAALLRFLREERVDVLDCSPSQLKLLLDEGLLDRPAPSMVLVGGEAIDDETWQRLAQSRTTAFFNLYGPTECTVDATACRIASTMPPSIGRPLANVEVYVLDANRRPLPVGVPGELYVGGAGLARGYRGRPEMTGERFVPHPWREGRLYRTGDRVRYRDGGLLEFLGRVDDQIKVRGYRVEPAEIEAALVRHREVGDARVLLRDGRLVAYLVGGGSIPPDALARFLREQLPDFMIPAAFVWLPRLPLTRGGKLDRAALPAPDSGRPAIEKTFVAPRSEDERAMAAIWQAFLGVDDIGVHDDFFAELGGHSLIAMRVIARVRDAFAVELPLRQIFEQPTVAGLVAAVNELRRAPAAPPMPELTRAPRDLHRATLDADGRIVMPEALRHLTRDLDS